MIDKTVNRAVVGMFVFMFGVLCFAFGSIGHQPYDQTRVADAKPKIVIKDRVEIQVQKEYVQAAPCIEANKLTEAVIQATSAYEHVLGEETDVQNDSYNAVTQLERNTVAERHRKVIRDTLDAALALQESQKDLKLAVEKCRNYPVK